jgi:hypothetical protein
MIDKIVSSDFDLKSAWDGRIITYSGNDDRRIVGSDFDLKLMDGDGQIITKLVNLIVVS